MFSTIIALHGHHGWGWGPGPWLGLVWLLFWVCTFAAVVWWLRRRAGGRPGEDVLAERYARGDITAEEFRQRLAVLKERAR
jgi:putative membrane protein